MHANQTIRVPVEFERATFVSADVPQDHRRVEAAREQPLLLGIPEQTLHASCVARQGGDHLAFVISFNLKKMYIAVGIADEALPREFVHCERQRPRGQSVGTTRMLMIVIVRVGRVPVQFLLATDAQQQFIVR